MSLSCRRFPPRFFDFFVLKCLYISLLFVHLIDLLLRTFCRIFSAQPSPNPLTKLTHRRAVADAKSHIKSFIKHQVRPSSSPCHRVPSKPDPLVPHQEQDNNAKASAYAAHWYRQTVAKAKEEYDLVCAPPPPPPTPPFLLFSCSLVLPTPLLLAPPPMTIALLALNPRPRDTFLPRMKSALPLLPLPPNLKALTTYG